jgi:exodeoxyribonuclease V beta subunit
MAKNNEPRNFDLLESPLDGTSLIEASAGTGKTYTITGLVLRLILERRFLINEILVVTYTVAATEELRDRIRRRLRETLEAFQTGQSQDAIIAGLLKKTPNAKTSIQLLRDALYDFDEAPVFTIHGFCQRALHENAFESGSLFDTELMPDEARLKEEIVHDFWRRHFYKASPEFISYVQSMDYKPKVFSDLLGKGIAHPDMKIIAGRRTEKLKSLEPCRKAFDRMRKAWPQARQKVKEKLGDKALDQRQYRNSSGFMEEMESYLSPTRPTFPAFKSFVKFTISFLAERTNKNRTTPTHPFFHLCEEFWATAETLQKEMDQHLLFLKEKLFEYARQELPARKQRQNVQSYDDLLTKLRGSLEKEGGDELAKAIRGKYKAALIDEFQDTDPVQYAIFRSVFSRKGSILFFIGDPKQAIYSFRGADLFAYMKAAGQVESRYTLTKNWRSEAGLIRAVNTIFSNRDHPFLYEEIPFEPASPDESGSHDALKIDGRAEAPFHLWYANVDMLDGETQVMTKGKARDLIPQAVASEISHLVELGQKGRARIGEKNLQESDIAVLVRSKNDARLIQKSLHESGIPSVLHSTGNLFDTDEALHMGRVLAAIAEPNQERLLKVALATDFIGVSGEDLDRLMEDGAGWENWLSRFREYFELWERGGFIRMFRYFLFREKVRTRLLSLPDGERRLTNVLHLSEVLHQEATEQKLGMVGLLKWLARQRDPNAPRLEEHELRLENDANAVKIVTIHKSKGLEYPVVFCPFNWVVYKSKEGEEFTFHDPEHWDLNLVLDPEGSPHRALAEKESLAENLRLLYVSLTRAKNRCYLVWGRFNQAETSSLAYVLHPSDGESGDAVKATGEHFNSLTDQEIRSDVEALVRKSKGEIQRSDMSVEPGREQLPLQSISEVLISRTFSGVIERERQMASFSSLIARRPQPANIPEHASVDLPDHDQGPIKEERIQEELPGIFAFPKGAKAGTLIHDIFEHLDFAVPQDGSVRKLVSDKLREHGFEARWEETLCDMIRKVLTASLLPECNGLMLSSISMEDRLSELEFYFPLESITPKKLKQIFAAHGGTEIPTEFPDQIEDLNFLPARGFMKGFIDLIFQSQGRFYLVDWKSNFLGITPKDYGPEAMAVEMREQFYILQYHLYVVALTQYLKLRVPDYAYDRHFGGVFYIFVRGVDPETGPQFGIYRDLPKKGLIDGLCKNLIG